MKVVAGHQPNFLPWFGYFEKMLKSDLFVFSDDVAYPKQCYVNRVEILISKKPAFITLPVYKGNNKKISDKTYIKDKKVLSKILKTIHINLSCYSFAKDIDPIIDKFSEIFFQYNTIADFNINMIEFVGQTLGINVQTIRGTKLNLQNYKKNDRLIKRCELLNSKIYLCGKGADGYQDDDYLLNSGINVRKIDYSLGHKLFGPYLKYSILLCIAKFGIKLIQEEVNKFKEKNTFIDS